ncbi:MAG: hypothetical protein J4F34_07845, partial [Gemmatimonadetes bacterium]|nr:hypothetical protein [Gemmatimonadota bacterium]
RGEVDLPNTIYVEGLEGFFPYYSAFRRDCGGLVGVTGEGHDYLPWRNLNDVIPIVEDTFGYARGPIKWVVDPEARYPYPHYIRRDDEVGLPGGTYAYPRVVAHEYTHALHHKGMGGLWETENCGYRESRESYTCAFSEGLAHYGGWAGVSDDTSEWSWEEVTHTNHPPDPKSTFSVARLFHDLIDGAKSILERPDSVAEPEDRTQLDARYIMDVFATCEVNIPRRGDDNWEDRNDVSDFVWCLENRIDTPYHTSVFPGIETPHDVRETAREPSDWDADSIRSTWLWNLCDDC